jgi:hypothetical protein
VLQHADAAVVHLIGGRERDLRRPGAGAGLLVRIVGYSGTKRGSGY